MVQPWRLSAVETLSQIRDGGLTVEEYARSLLKRIHERDVDVQAWVYLNEDLIITRAKQLDSIPPDQRGPLHGLPIGIKDVMLTEDMPTQYNSKLYESPSPINIDAAPVATLRASGALIFGKTTTTEFATTPQGRYHQNMTKNARDLTRTPGGSSSGSGAAVADYQVPLALGTQTGGSIIRPASFNGCFGWKPTWGVISREGLAQWCPTLDTCGFFARSVNDLELIADVFSIQADPRLNRRDFLKGARIGFCRTPLWHRAGAGTREAMSSAEDLLRGAGAWIEQIELHDDFAKLERWHGDILAGEGRSSFLHHHLKGAGLLHNQVKGYVEQPYAVTATSLSNAYDGCALLRPVWDKLAARFDAILAPSVPDEAPIGQEHTGDMVLCSMWTALHVPVINIPGFSGENDMPIGLSLVGARYQDRVLLSMARLVGDVLADSATRLTRNPPPMASSKLSHGAFTAPYGS